MIPYLTRIDLSKAIKANDFARVKEIVTSALKAKTFNEIVDYKPTDKNEVPPALLTAAACGNKEIVEYLLVSGANINQTNIKDHTALYVAFSNQRFEIAKHLIEKGANIDQCSTIGTRTMDMAIRSGSMKWTKWFMDKGFPLANTSPAGRNTLHYATQSSNLELLQFIEENTPFKHTDEDDQGMRPMDFCKDVKILSYIHQKHPDLPLNKTFKNDDCSLLQFALSGAKEIVEFLLDKGIDSKITGKHKNTLMHYAVNSKNKELVLSLIQRKISVEGRNKYNYRPLHWAAELGDLDLVKILVEEGKAKINIKTNNVFIIRETETPLFMAIKKEHYDIAKYLVEKGADINDLNNDSNATALTEACQKDNLEMITFLLEHGASPNGVNKNKESSHPDYYYFPLREAKSAEAVNILIQYGADVNAIDRYTINPTSALRNLVNNLEKKDLQTEQGKKQLQAIQALLDHGASLNDGNDRTMESDAKCKEVIEILLAAKKKAQSTPQKQTKEPSTQKAGLFDNLLAKFLNPVGQNAELGKALLETSLHCGTEGKLESFIAIVQEANKDAVNYNHGQYNEDRESPLHRILDSARYSEYNPEDFPSLARYIEAVKLLLEKGANPNAIEKLYSETALHKAAKVATSGYTKKEDLEQLKILLDLLIQHGADPDIENEDHKTATTLLAEGGKKELIPTLKKD